MILKMIRKCNHLRVVRRVWWPGITRLQVEQESVSKLVDYGNVCLKYLEQYYQSGHDIYIYICVCVYIYIYMCVCVCVCVCVRVCKVEVHHRTFHEVPKGE